MIRIITLSLLALSLIVCAQDSDFRRQIQSTRFTRELLTQPSAADVRDLLNVTDITGLAPTKTNLAALASHSGGTNNQTLYVLGFATPRDWGGPRAFTLDTASTAATNLVTITNSGGTGNWIHSWDGDASALGILPSTSDCGVRLTAATQLAISNSIALSVTVPGDYYLTTTNGFQIPSNARIKFGPNVWLVGNYDGSTSSFADPAKAFVRNSGVTGWPADGELTVINTNIVIDGLRVRANGSNIGYGFVMFGVADAYWRNFEIGPLNSAWAFNVSASNVVSTGHKIRNEGAVYQDGVHIIGGSKQVWSDLDIHSGDDAIAVSSINSVPIRDIVIQNAVVRSQYAHAIRLNQEYAENTNLIERVSFSNIYGESGQERNGQVRFDNSSTNVSRPFRTISLSNIKVRGRTSGPPAIGVDYGFYLSSVDGLTVENCWSGETVYQNLWVTNAGNVRISKFFGTGSRGTAFNQTLRATADDITIDESTFLVSTTTTNTGVPLYFDKCGTVKVFGSTFVQQNSGQHAILFDGTASTNVVISGNSFAITGAGSPVGFAVNPVNALLTGNINNGTNVVSWASGVQPENSVVFGNHGVAPGIGAANGYLPGKLELAANLTDYFIRLNRPGIGTADIGLTGNRLTLVPSSGAMTLSSVTTANTTKSGIFGLMGYGASDTPLVMVGGSAAVSANTVNIGGGSSSGQSATTLSFYATNAIGTGIGVEVARLTGTLHATNNSTPLYLIHSNTVRQVWATNISGIPNVLYIP